MGKTAKYNLSFPNPTDKANVAQDIQNLAEAAETALENKVNSEIGKRLMTDAEGEKLKTLENYDDSKLQEIIDNQSIEIGYLNKVKKQLLEDYKKIPFNSSSNHLVDTGELPILDFGINGKIEQDTREGYNLFNIEDYTDNNKFMTSISSDKFVATSRLSSTTNYEQVFYFNNIPLKTGITYTLREVMKILSGTPVSGTGQVELYNGSTWVKVIVGGSKTEVDRKITFTVDEDNTYRIRIKIAGSNDVTEVFSVEFSNLMIYEGTKDKPYEQYGSMPSIEFPSPVKGVSGHYDNKIETKNICPTDFNDWESGHYEQSGNKGDYPSRLRLKELLRVKPSETYYFALNTTNKYLRFIIRCYGQNKEFISSYGLLTDGATFVTMDNVYYLGISIYDTTVATDDIYETYKTMFESGNLKPFICLNSETDKTFIEHQEQNLPIDLPIGQVWYSGKPYKENGKWYRDVEWGKYVFTGDEYWSLSTSWISNITNVFYVNLTINAKFENQTEVYQKSNYFKGASRNTVMNNEEHLICYSGTMNAEITAVTLRIDKTIAPTVDNLEAWLKEKYNSEEPVYMVYQLAKPYAEEITDTTLISQLEGFPKADSYKGVTNINSYKSSEDVADLVLSGNALMSNDIRMSKIENAILSLGGNV